MQAVQTDFDERAKEVDEYFEFVNAILSADSELAYTDSVGGASAYKVSSDLQKTLKANGFLLVYNLVESTMKNALEAIIHHLLAQRISFDDLSSRVKLIILKNAKACNAEKLEPLLTQIDLDIIQHTFRKEELFSGNVDAKAIKDTMKTYGISSRNTVNGNCLLTIKTQRNALAHGDVSFTECGRGYDITELIQYKNDAKDYLQATLNDVKRFLSNDDFRK